MTFDEFIKEWQNREPYIIVRTSGSTGKPKEIRLSKKFVEDSAHRTNSFFGITSENFLYSCIAADFIGGKMMAVRSLVANCRFFYEEPTNTPLLNLPKNLEIDLLAVVPSQMVFILENLSMLPYLKHIIIGGSAINPILKNKIAHSGLNAFETYGMTETASHIALRKIGFEDNPFMLLPGINISTDLDNCLKIKFETGEVIQTNDIVEIISEKEFYVKGRRDNIIISGGKKINPFEIEEALTPIISDPFYITGKPDEKWGHKLVVVIESQEKSYSLIDLNSQLISKIEKWKLPKEIVYLKKLPRTLNGKIIRQLMD